MHHWGRIGSYHIVEMPPAVFGSDQGQRGQRGSPPKRGEKG